MTQSHTVKDNSHTLEQLTEIVNGIEAWGNRFIGSSLAYKSLGYRNVFLFETPTPGDSRPDANSFIFAKALPDDTDEIWHGPLVVEGSVNSVHYYACRKK